MNKMRHVTAISFFALYFVLNAGATIAMAEPLTPSLLSPLELKGQTLYTARCTACHSVDYNGIGPAHKNVVGRNAGVVKGYTYSPALKASKLVWNERNLDQWLANPELLVPGQKMFIPTPDADERAALIAYLKSISK